MSKSCLLNNPDFQLSDSDKDTLGRKKSELWLKEVLAANRLIIESHVFITSLFIVELFAYVHRAQLI